jgi:hypothetical protein
VSVLVGNGDLRLKVDIPTTDAEHKEFRRFDEHETEQFDVQHLEGLHRSKRTRRNDLYQYRQSHPYNPCLMDKPTQKQLPLVREDYFRLINCKSYRIA